MVNFDTILVGLSSIISSIGVAIITFGALKAVYILFKHFFGSSPLNIVSIRLELGYSIILGLEFMVGADIIESVAQPNYYHVGLLALLVVIRTFLSYFLNKELEHLTPEQKKHIG